MSYVHFLDVFDPANLPAGLSDRDAVEQARSLRLAAPSPRLLALLTRIRQQPPGITVNVVGGKDQQPVHWVQAKPPRVKGDGANCALWTLILPVDDDYEALQNAVPRLVVLARSLGLRVFDEAQEALVRPIPEQPLNTAPKMNRQELPGVGDIAIFASPDWLMPIFGPMTIHGWNVRQAVQQCLDRDFTKYKDYSPFNSPNLPRLLARMLQIFPFETHGQRFWCGRNPLTDPIFKLPGMRLIRVAPEYRIEALKKLLPLARELFLMVAVPEMNLFVERTRDPSDFRSTQSFDLGGLDQDWDKHLLTVQQREELFLHALIPVLEAHGFSALADKLTPISFSRPLRGGGGRQVIRFSYEGGGLDVYVQSERFLSVKDVCGFLAEMRTCGWKGDLSDANIVRLEWSDVCRKDDANACNWYGRPDSAEEIAWAVEDIQRFLLPQLDQLHTAQDLWQWLSRPDGKFPGTSDLLRLKKWFAINPSHACISDSLYAARCLPDEEFEPLLQMWEESLQSRLLMHPDRDAFKALHHSIENSLKNAAALRKLPQTPMDAPM